MYLVRLQAFGLRGMRRTVAGVLAIAFLTIATAANALVIGEGEPFSFDRLSERMKALAASEYIAPPTTDDPFLLGLDYDAYRQIQPKDAVPLGTAAEPGAGYDLQPFHMGWLFKEPVRIFEIDGDVAKPLTFTADDFKYLDPDLAAESKGRSWPGTAGFRLRYPLNAGGVPDELVAFLGASYFRALGRNNVYGTSARGLAIDTWLGGPEEFPRFSAFYVDHAEAGEPLVVFAALESASVTGAFRFAFAPADDLRQDTEIEVDARLYFRKDVKEVGIAPLTSMFLYAEGNRSLFDDYRPQVHDSNGLFVRRASGEVLWRALNNVGHLLNSYIAEESPAAFGLMQRDRDFAAYQDAGAHYERRPSVLVEPVGDWGKGWVRLVEAPAKLEAEDNIVAFWVPEKPFKAGDSAEYKYRLRWGDLQPDPAGTLAHVVETRTGQGGVSGVENAANLRKFVVDYSGGPLTALNDDDVVDVVATVSPGNIVHATAFRIEATGDWRLVIDAEIPPATPVELRAYLVGDGRQLSETWLYQWQSQ